METVPVPLETEETLQEDNRRREGLSQTEDLALYFRERSEEISGIRGSYSKNYNAPVVTFVICSSKVKVLRDRIVDGINTYRVHLIRLKDEDADKVLDRIRENGAGCLSREDIILLLFSPLMGGRSEQKDRILQGIRILKSGERIFPKEDYYFCGFFLTISFFAI